MSQPIRYGGQACQVDCDRQCAKAWGINQRPRHYFDGAKGKKDPDDFVFLPDSRLETAPSDPGTYEGGHGKPSATFWTGELNKWCVRECERSVMVEVGETLTLPDFEDPKPNKHARKFSWKTYGCDIA